MSRFWLLASGFCILALVLSGCYGDLDPCTFDKSVPACDLSRSKAQATIGAIDADAALRATQDAVYLRAEQTKAAVSVQATKQMVQAEATHAAMNTEATRQAIAAAQAQSAVIYRSTQTSVDAEATTIAVNVSGAIERARFEREAIPANSIFSIAVFWFLLPGLAVAAVIVLGKRTIAATTQAMKQTLMKNAAKVLYGPANNPQIGFLAFNQGTGQPSLFITAEGLIGNFADLLNGKTELDRLQVPDELKLAALVESNKRSQAARIAAATGRAPWTVSPSYESAPAIISAPAPATSSAITPPPTFAELLRNWRPNPQQMLLGLNDAGVPRYSQLDGLLSVGVIGMPGSGKSTVLRFHYLQCRLVGARVVVWDLHRSIIKTLPGAEAFVTLEAIDQSAGQIDQLLQQRLDCELYDDQPVMVLADEYLQLAPNSETASRVIGRIILEGRKVKMYAMISGHGLPARMFGGSEVRDSLSSRIVLHSTPRQAERVGLDKRAIPWVIGLQPGSAIVEGPIDAEILRVPNTTEADVRAYLPASQPENEVLRPASPTSDEAAWAEVLRPSEAAPEAADPFDEAPAEVDSKRQKVLEMLRSGASQNQVIKTIYGATGGEKYQRASAEIRQIVQESIA